MAKGVSLKNKPDKGWIKELSKPTKASNPKPTFGYSKPVVSPPKPNSMALNHRLREFQSVKQDKSTNICTEQNSAKTSHKGK